MWAVRRQASTPARITAVGTSEASVTQLERRFRTNPAFSARYDRQGSLDGGAGDLSLVLCVSVLHDIPDYLTSLRAMAERVAPGGSLLTSQDPLWYPRHPRAHAADCRVAAVLAVTATALSTIGTGQTQLTEVGGSNNLATVTTQLGGVADHLVVHLDPTNVIALIAVAVHSA